MSLKQKYANGMCNFGLPYYFSGNESGIVYPKWRQDYPILCYWQLMWKVLLKEMQF